MFVCFFFRTIFLPPTGRGVSLSLGTLFCIAKFYSFFFLSLRWFGPPHSNLIRFPPWNDVSVTKTKKKRSKDEKKKGKKNERCRLFVIDAVLTNQQRVDERRHYRPPPRRRLPFTHTHTHARTPHNKTIKQQEEKNRKRQPKQRRPLGATASSVDRRAWPYWVLFYRVFLVAVVVVVVVVVVVRPRVDCVERG